MTRNKKDIDKELMYKKLMPSGSRSARPEAGEAEPSGPATPSPGTETAPGWAAPVPPPAARRTQEPRKVSVPVLDSRQTQIVNVMEAAVMGKLESVLARFQCCRCDRCKKDIIALALNRLPPRYMVLSEGQVPPDIDPKVNAQIVAAMIQAVLKVRAKPRH